MIADHGAPGWKLKCIVAEVGCRGYIPPSFRKALQHFGFTSKELKKSFIPFQMVPIDTAAYKSIAVV